MPKTGQNKKPKHPSKKPNQNPNLDPGTTRNFIEIVDGEHTNYLPATPSKKPRSKKPNTGTPEKKALLRYSRAVVDRMNHFTKVKCKEYHTPVESGSCSSCPLNTQHTKSSEFCLLMVVREGAREIIKQLG